MGLFDLLSKEGRAKSALRRYTSKVLNKHLQSMDRMAAMEKLRELDTDEALHVLARRFSYVYDKTIEDEQEKAWVESVLVGKGERAIPAVRRFALESDSLAWPLRVLEKIATPERMLAILDELIAREEPGYTRDPSKRVQLLTWMGDWRGAPHAEIARRIVPYLGDFDESVRFTAVEALAQHRDESSSKEPLLDALLRPEEESRRVKVRVAEVLADAGWTITDRKDAVARLLEAELPEFGMHHDKLTRKAKKER